MVASLCYPAKRWMPSPNGSNIETKISSRKSSVIVKAAWIFAACMVMCWREFRIDALENRMEELDL